MLYAPLLKHDTKVPPLILPILQATAGNQQEFPSQEGLGVCHPQLQPVKKN
ncbi:hypothetical protein M2459_002737 [Parabacteroides sp. PF5-5]|nr:hypothetical protein [Parabacteroides sp. PH5-39]MDH6316983.1 hypothetical protein [Parabacteroides sp. PF5-13]MDH6320736.1 hypothetical protein [Parabacteroides sp. PH5-13]MDH6324562.1 hypothetical protein [Parabacteroides sp. PH5-8]MDH6328168.1 hypothetical protein [Parabacteroides sp. PH5-41]MDH6335970.1 hypothetical protein [Parabacteroides sp. PF5-5]MDH6347129.1 hypothetical protein [Parabacteroides sp. PH5-46]MDH6362091.1 hypothetical protein [Parabacteroides sp. PH5-16]MDH6377759.